MTTTRDRRRVASKLAIPTDISFLAWPGADACTPRPMFTKTANDHAAAWQEMLTSHSGNQPSGPAPSLCFWTRSSLRQVCRWWGQSARDRRITHRTAFWNHSYNWGAHPQSRAPLITAADAGLCRSLTTKEREHGG
jgi:hypothetical protein